MMRARQALDTSSRPADLLRARRKVGVLTIGQSPRSDRLGEDVRAVLGSETEVIERGALDGMSDAEIADIAPTEASQYRLVTLLRTGRPVEIGKPAILARLQAHIQHLEQSEGVDATLLMCTGAFPSFDHTKPLLRRRKRCMGPYRESQARAPLVR